jgi:hypothetical protein
MDMPVASCERLCGLVVRVSRKIFEKIPQMSNFMKIHTVGAELFHANGRTDRHDEANK